MNLLKLFEAARQNGRVAGVSKEVADRSCPVVWPRVQHVALVMSAPEARGYIRAQSSAAVLSEVDAALRRRSGLSASMRPQLVEAAKDHVVRMLLDEVQRVQRTWFHGRKAA